MLSTCEPRKKPSEQSWRPWLVFVLSPSDGFLTLYFQKTKVDDLTKNIADTRTGVTEVKTFIDGMRTSRDTKMAELNALKTQLKEQNQRLLQVTQERAKIESKNKVNQRKMEDGLGKSDSRFVLKSNSNSR